MNSVSFGGIHFSLASFCVDIQLLHLSSFTAQRYSFSGKNGDLRVGIRRAKRGIGGGPEVSSGGNSGDSNSASSMYRGFSGFLSENGNLTMGNVTKGNGNCSLGLREMGNFVSQLSVPSLLSNTLNLSSPSCFLQHNISTGIQGARQAQFRLSSLDLHFKNLQAGLHLFESKKEA
ncbi:unnamed protein product [Fraxinus pennsylvanica]|uniref:Uncharacterized protein n=1 Tax=Fraxinus pennsylvanica TaxID=56036 RepID=A0AAD2DNQ3_9LAMI|nr:unnamed protein product [Fraxinus pennsylvanica]